MRSIVFQLRVVTRIPVFVSRNLPGCPGRPPFNPRGDGPSALRVSYFGCRNAPFQTDAVRRMMIVTIRPRNGASEMLNSYSTRMRLSGTLLLGGVFAVAGMALGAVAADADPGLIPPTHVRLSDGGPWTWCPGDPMSGLNSTTHKGGPGDGVDWDMNVCHTWWGVNWGTGNVAPGVWDGPDPPPLNATQKPPCGFPFMCSGTP
jgi:hypothetical protein